MRLLNGSGWMRSVWPENFRLPKENNFSGSQQFRKAKRATAITFAVLLSTFYFGIVEAQNKGEYFFDTDPGAGAGTSLTMAAGDSVTISPTISVASLSAGFHVLYVRTRMAGKWSTTESRTFYKLTTTVSASRKIKRFEYFFDTDPGVGSGTQFSGFTASDSLETTRTISISSLASGFHVLYIRSQDETNAWSQAESRPFYISPTSTISAGPISRLEYFFDADPGAGLGTAIAISPSADSSEKTTAIPISALSAGFHTIYVRAKNNRGWSMTESRTFFVTSSASATAGPISRLEYFFDTDPGAGLGTAISVSPSADSSEKTTVIPVSALSSGFHTIYVRAKNNRGWSITESRTFFITSSASANAGPISQLEYFFDADPGIGLATKINVNPSADSSEKTSVIPISSLSTGFHTVYIRAKNNRGWSQTETRSFYVYPATAANSGPVAKMEFFIDTDPGVGLGTALTAFTSGDSVEVTRVILVPSNLAAGAHKLYVRSQTSDKRWAITEVKDFTIDCAEISITATQTQICSGASTTLSFASGNQPGTYQWYRNAVLIPGATAFSFTTTQTGGYTLRYQFGTCLDTSDVLLIGVGTSVTATATASGSTNICAGSTVNINANSGTGLTYQWLLNNNSIASQTGIQLANVAASGSYSVIVTNITGCKDTSNVIQVTVTPLPPKPSISANGPTTFCDGGSVILTTTAASGRWSTGETTTSITVSGSAIIRDTAIVNGCKIVSDPVTITENPCNDLPGSGNALRFDGIDDYVQAGTTGFTGIQTYTIECWLKKKAPNPASHVWEFNGLSSPSLESNGTNGLNFWVGNSSSLSTGELVQEQWYHIACVYDKTANRQNLYVNGILKATANVNVADAIGTDLGLMRRLFGSPRYFNGALDEFRIWNVARTQAQIQAEMCRKIANSASLASLVTYFNFDEISGLFTFSQAGLDLDGILTNGVVRETSGAPIGDDATTQFQASGLPTVTFTNGSQETFNATFTGGNASGDRGAVVYVVKEKPNSQAGISGVGTNDRYYGVFAAGITSPQYTAVYNYGTNPFVTVGNENSLALFKRTDNSVTSWTNAFATRNTTTNTLTVTGQSTEYMIGVGAGGEVNPGTIGSDQVISCSNVVPALLSSIADATTTTGFPITYQWQDSTKGGSWQNIASATASTFQPPLLSDSTWYRRKATASTFSAFSNEVAILIQAVSAGDPAFFPTNKWNVYGYSGTDMALGVGNLYKGFYEVSSLDFNSGNQWNSGASPSFATNWQGCSVPVDNFTFVLKRKGFPTGAYVMNVLSHDDQINVIVNGSFAYAANCCGPSGNLTLGTMDANSEIEIRMVEFGGGASISFTLVTQSLVPGTIGSNQTICGGATPSQLNSSLNAFGGPTSTITYQWQDSTVGNSWANIAAATSTTFQPGSLSATTWYRRKAVNGAESAISNEVQITINFPTGDATTFPSNSWNLNGYSGTDIELGSGNVYLGFYNVNLLDINTQDQWSAGASPSSFAGYSGCPVPVDNFTFVLKRRGFPAGPYTLNILNHDDRVRVYVNGTEVFDHNGCCDVHNGIDLGTLGTNSTVEVRTVENGGSAQVALAFIASNFQGGIIAADQNLCSGTTPLALTNVQDASGGGIGTITYQWQDSTSGGSWQNIDAATSLGYQPELLTTTTWFRRKATGGTTIVYSNEVMISVIAAPTVSVTPLGPINFCSGLSTTLTGVFSVGSARQWLRNNVVISNQTTATLSVNASGTYKAVAFNGSCTDTSNAVVITVNPKPAPVVSPAGPLTLCQGLGITLDLANPVNGQTNQWKKDGAPISGGNSISVNTAGSYYIVSTVTATGCKDSSNVVIINIVNPQITPVGPVSICSGLSAVLTAANVGTASLKWFRNNGEIPGQTGPTLSITLAGTYRLDATVGVSCTVSSNDVVANVVALPSANITPPTTTSFCSGSNLVLEANNGTGLTYQWKRNNLNINGETNEKLTVNQAGDYTVEVKNSLNCTNVSDPVTLTELSNIAWFIDADADGYGTGTTVSNCFRPANGFLSSELIATIGDCNDNDATINPSRQFFAFSGGQGFASALTSPLTGTAYTNFRFEVTYTDLNNNPPPATFPRVILDYEGNGQLNNGNDRTILMTQADSKDLTTNNGKKYFATVNSLPSGQDYTTRILTSIGNCATTIGPFNYPDVFILSDLQIFANDITFDNTNPNVSSPLTVSAVIHNVSDFSAQNFVVHLVNQYNPSIVYPDIIVPNLAPHSDQTVTWNITTPAEAAWCPMQVNIDFTNLIEETNELDNSAIRPFVNGPFNVPGEITVTPSVSPSTVVGVSGASVTLVGVANYSGTAVPLQDPSVAGAQVTFTVNPGGQTYTTYTNSSGQINFSFYVPLTPGTYTITGTITDFTLTSTFTLTFIVVPPVCLPDLTASLSVSNTNLVEGESITGNVRITNVGCEPVTDSTLMKMSQSGGTPLAPNVKIPPLAVGEHYDIPLSSILFDTPGTYSICGLADGNFEVAEQSEGNNQDCRIITVIPFLPDIYPTGCGVGGQVYLSSQVYTHGFSMYNSGGSGTGPFTTRIIVFKDGIPLDTFDRLVPNIPRQSGASVSVDYVYTETGTYSFSMACDIPVPPGVVAETNENNNTSACGILILAPQTDLAINSCENFDVDPVDPAFPGNITLKARVVNQGNLTATAPILVRFTRTSGSVDNVVITNDLAPGQSVLVTKQIASTAPGTDTASVVVDPLNVFNEFNEGNNGQSNKLCHESAPVDNYCGGNWWSGTYLVNQAIFLNVPVAVSGLYNISQLKVRFFVRGPGLNGTLNLGDATLDNVSETCGCPYVATLPVNFAFPQEGQYIFTFVTDPDNLYTECNENNNTLVRSVKVSGLPDMRMLSQGINPSLLNPDVGEPITIDANYENIGQANIDQFMKVKLLVDEIAVDSQTVKGLVTGDNFTVNFSTPWASTLVGAHIIRTIIDADHEVEEGNEQNNEATRAVIVGAAANLYFQVFQPSNSSPAIGNNISIQARIGNAGDVEVDGVVQFFYVTNLNDTVQIGQQGVSLDQHDSVTINLPWTVVDNNTVLIGKIVNATVMEFNYEDNMATAPIGGFGVTLASTPSCAGKPNGTLTPSTTGGTAPFTYLWSTGFTGSVLTAGPGLYNVQVTDANSVAILASGSIPNIPGVRYYLDADGDGHGNPAIDSVDCTQPIGYVKDSIDCNDGNITVYKKTGKPSISHNGNLTFCSGGSVTLSVPASNFINYRWSTSETTTSIVVSTGGSFTVEASQDSGCVATSNPVITNLITNLTPTASITVSPDSVVCTSTQITFTATTSGGGPNPISEWLVNGNVATTGGNTFSGSSFNNNDRVELRYISSESCANPDTVLSNFIRLQIGNTLTANAGPDKSVCSDSTRLEATGSGTWSFVNGDPTIFNSTSPTTLVADLELGLNQFVWTVTSGTCPVATDTVDIFVLAAPSTADAGSDQPVCSEDASLDAIPPTVGTGIWTLISGAGTIEVNSDPNSLVENLGVGTNTFVWSIAFGTCPASTDTVSIVREATPGISLAGEDQVLCLDSTILSGNNPAIGTGMWSVVTGSAVLSDPTSATAAVHNLATGLNQFVWTISNGTCPSNTDTVSITVNPFPTTADAGSDQTLCNSDANLSGNAPQSGTGTWTLISGTGTIEDNSDPNSLVENLGVGTNTFVWSIAFGTCPASTDTVVITREQSPGISLAGDDQVLCLDSTTLTGNIPAIGTGMWSVVAGSAVLSDPTSATTAVHNLATGLNQFVWTISNGTCLASTDTVSLTVNPFPTTANAGSDQTLCTADVNLSGNTPQSGTGTWTMISGTGTIEDNSDPNTLVENLGVGTNTFVWSISFGTCPASTDTVVITREQSPGISLAGDDQTLCIDSTTLNGNIPAVGTGMWSVVTGTAVLSDPTSATSAVHNLAMGLNQFVWTISNGTCPSTNDTVDVVVSQPAIINAGNDTTICTSSLILHPNPVSGTWTVLSGGGSLSGDTVSGLSIGVNELVYTVAQSGGCVSTDTINIIRVDSSQNAEAGPDQILCSQTTATLAATTPANGIGAWTVISGTAVVEDPSNPNSAVTGLSFGDHVLRWTVTNDPCPAVFDELTISITNSLVANAGPDTIICGTAFTLNGNGQGEWTLVSGSGTIVSPNSVTTSVTGLGIGVNTFQWKLISLGCPSDSNDIAITVTPDATTAQAGIDQSLCADSATVSGNVPVVGTGMWMVISGTGVVSDPLSATTSVHNLSVGTNELVWMVMNICGENSDTVILTVSPPPTVANAGPDDTLCADVAALQGNTPTSGTGLWTVIQGGGSIPDPTIPNAELQSMGVGLNVAVWSISVGSCTPSTDTVKITRDALITLSNAGIDQGICTNETILDGNPSGNGLWTVASGAGVFANANQANTLVSDLQSGLNRFAWTITNGTCSSSTDTVDVVFTAPPSQANAGVDQVLCLNSTSLSADLPPTGTGSWNVLIGSGAITDPSSPTSEVTNLSVGLNELIWSVTNGTCPPSMDTVRLFVSPAISVVNAGADTAVCGSLDTLNAQSPLVGLWTTGAGTLAQILEPTNPRSAVSGMQPGSNMFIWTAGVAPCPTKSDTVIIISNPSVAANAGLSFIACGDTATLNAVPPGFGAGLWSVEQGSAILANPGAVNSKVSNLAIGLNTFRWTISVATCPDVSDTMTIERLANPVLLGNDTLICTDSLLTLDAGAGFNSYLWQDGSSQQTFLVDTAGIYFVDVSTVGNCTFRDSLVVTEAICTDVDPLLSAQIQWAVFPNPSKGNFEIQVFNARAGSSRIRMYNGLGVCVFEDRITPAANDWTYSLKTKDLPNGVYYLEVDMGPHKLKKKVVLVD